MITSNEVVPYSEREEKNSPIFFSSEEYRLLTAAFKNLVGNGRYEKQEKGQKRAKIASTLTVGQILTNSSHPLYPILKLDDEIYAIGEMIGNGAYGKVKLTENALGKKFVLKSFETVLEPQQQIFQDSLTDKRLQTKNNSQRPRRMSLAEIKKISGNKKVIDYDVLKSLVQREIEVLQALGRGSGQVIERVIERDVTKVQFNILMNYHHGVKASKIIQDRDVELLHPSFYYQIALAIGLDLNLLHQVGFYHGDLKPDNIIIDEVNMTAHLIDFNSATYIGKDEPRLCTPCFADPDSLTRSTLQSEIYELGLTWALLLGFGKISTNDYVHFEWFDRPNDHIEQRAYDYIRFGMMNSEREKRPSLKDALDEMKSLVVIIADLPQNCGEPLQSRKTSFFSNSGLFFPQNNNNNASLSTIEIKDNLENSKHEDPSTIVNSII